MVVLEAVVSGAVKLYCAAMTLVSLYTVDGGVSLRSFCSRGWNCLTFTSQLVPMVAQLVFSHYYRSRIWLSDIARFCEPGEGSCIRHPYCHSVLFLLPSSQRGSDRFCFSQQTKQPSCFLSSGGGCNNLLLL